MEEKEGREGPWPKVCACNFVIWSSECSSAWGKRLGCVYALAAARLVGPVLGKGMRGCLGRYSLERVLRERRKRKVQERANKMSKRIHPHQAECLRVTDVRGWRMVPFGM